MARIEPRDTFEIRIGRRTVRLGERTLVVGVLNVTPDSFSDGARYLDPEKAVERGLELERQGADWIDIGGESTRPGSKPVPAEEELCRVLPVVREVHRRLPSLPISIDTTKAEVAEAAVRAGAGILNDVSGLRFDPRLGELARSRGLPLVLMHLRGRPETMQQRPFARSIWRSVLAGLGRSVGRALALGVRRSQLILDPGFGFGKSREQNFQILAHLGRLRRFRLPIMVGTSRKSFVQAAVAGEGAGRGRTTPPMPPRRRRYGAAVVAPASCRQRKNTVWRLLEEGRLEQLCLSDAAAVAASILLGAHIVRVHDVAAILPAARIADAILAAHGDRRR